MGRQEEIERMLKDLHDSYLKGNEHDESDLIYYRINYRLADVFGIKKEDAEKVHAGYHESKPRQISQGYCEKCDRVVFIIPVIYGIQKSDLEKIEEGQAQGRLIIGDLRAVREGVKVPMYGCKDCRNLLPKYGTI